MTEKTTYQLPPEPDGPVWDEEGDKWERSERGRWHCGNPEFGVAWTSLLVGLGPLTNAEPLPDWPSAPHVWWDGEVWTLDDDGEYLGPGDFWEVRHMRNGLSSDIRDKARRFAREAVPVTIVPTKEWEALRQCVDDEEPVWDAAEALVDAADSLAQEVAR